MNLKQEAIDTLLYNKFQPETFILRSLSNQIYLLKDCNNDDWVFTIRKRYGKLLLMAKNEFMTHYQEIYSFKLR